MYVKYTLILKNNEDLKKKKEELNNCVPVLRSASCMC